MNCEFRRCGDADLPALRRALERVYPHNPRLREVDYLEWQYRQAPGAAVDRPHQLWLNLRNGEIGGWLGCVPVEVAHGGAIVQGSYLQNWYAGSRDGAGFALFLKAVEPFAIRLMLGTTVEADRFYAAMQIPRLAAMPRWVAFPNPARACEIVGIASAQDVARVHTCHEELSRALGAPPGSTTWSDELAAERYRPPPEYGAVNGIVRSRAWLDWRYRKIPGHCYMSMTSDTGELVVYRTEQIAGRPDSVVRIVEWMVTERHAASALAEILRRTRADRILLIDFSCASPAVAAGLVRSGFAPIDEFTPGIVPALFRPLHAGHPISLALDFPPHRAARTVRWEEWYITRGDADLDRRKL